MTIPRGWTRSELLLAFRLYCKTPFGRLHRRNPEIVELARIIGRTPSAVAMKASNFASLDPAEAARRISGLGNVSRSDQALWEEFLAKPNTVALEAEAVADRLHGIENLQNDIRDKLDRDLALPGGPSAVERTVQARRVQSFFRGALLVSYDGRCAVTGLSVPELLTASHIIPWHVDTTRRADPRNGILLNALFDRAFDRGLITFDDDHRVVLSTRVQDAKDDGYRESSLLAFDGKRMQLPRRFEPDEQALDFHRNSVFLR